MDAQEQEKAGKREREHPPVRGRALDAAAHPSR